MADLSTNNSSSVVARSLSDLPDRILLHILSFLPTNGHASRTSRISRKWRNLWLSSPSLNFCSFTDGTSDLEYFRFFTSFVDKTLIYRPPNSPLLTFDLKLNINNGVFTSHVNSWIRYAVSHGVENLHLVLDFLGIGSSEKQDLDARFEFPFCVLRDSQVRVLKLRGCNLSLLSSSGNNAPPRFSSLQSINLDEVGMTDRVLEDFVAACVNLEVLFLSSVRGCKHFKICSSKLRELEIEFIKCEEGSVQIVAPNLSTLTIRHFVVGDYALENAASLDEAKVDIDEYQYWVKVMRLLGHVKHLSTSNWWFELIQSKEIFSECFILQNLKYVELGTSYRRSGLIGISLLLISSPNLQTMILRNHSIFDKTPEKSISEDFIKDLTFKLPCFRQLRQVKMKSFIGMEGEKIWLTILLKKAVILERIILIPAKGRGEAPHPPIVLDPQLYDPQDFGYFISQIPKRRKLLD